MTTADAVVSAVAPALDALTVLRKARALIEKPEHWTQGDYARDADGEPTDWWAHGNAVRFCSLGALRCATNEWSAPDEAMSALSRAMAGSDTYEPGVIHFFNDGHTHAEVIAAFDKAIASLESA